MEHMLLPISEPSGLDVDGSKKRSFKQVRGVYMAAAEKKTEIIDGYTIKYHANGKPGGQRAKWKTASLLVIGSGTA